ncbi:MAG: succinate dehydrogenase assembly factor 2 [Gammaproteobacteria bacterium]|nr:succinate dehydrogenase assembly factor 2 [Gammaproteobacteria bacterium]
MSDGRLRWRCRRGMKELDALLERWLDRRHAQASVIERRDFETLLELQDPELALYLLAGQPHPDPALRGLIEGIRRG